MTETGANARLVGKLLLLSALVLFAVGAAAWAGWLPYGPTAPVMATAFALFGLADLAIGLYFMVRYR
jgi:hypothetical protein